MCKNVLNTNSERNDLFCGFNGKQSLAGQVMKLGTYQNIFPNIRGSQKKSRIVVEVGSRSRIQMGRSIFCTHPRSSEMRYD